MSDAQPTAQPSWVEKVVELFKNSKSWPAILSMIGPFAIAVATLCIKMMLLKRQAALLDVEMTSAQEAATEAKENAVIADNAVAQAAAQRNISDAQALVAALQTQVAAAQIQHAVLVKQLQGVTTWDQINVTNG